MSSYSEGQTHSGPSIRRAARSGTAGRVAIGCAAGIAGLVCGVAAPSASAATSDEPPIHLDGAPVAKGTLTKSDYLEGGATDGKYWYVVGRTKNYTTGFATNRLTKIDMDTGKLVKQKTYAPRHSGGKELTNLLGHSNDIAWNADRHRLIVTVRDDPSFDRVLRVVNPDTLAIESTITIPTASKVSTATNALCYDPTRNRYVGGIPGQGTSSPSSMWTATESGGRMKFTSGPWNVPLKNDPTTQGIDCDSHYIYLVTSSHDMNKPGNNHIDVLDWNFQLVRRYSWHATSYEAEDLVHRNGNFYLSYNKAHDLPVKALSRVKDFQYRLTFDGNGGSGSMSAASVLYGKSTALPKNTFSKSGKRFVGWTATRLASDPANNTVLYQAPDDPHKHAWLKPGTQHKGWKPYVYADRQAVAKTAEAGTVRMSAVWADPT